jgi:phosphoribosylglycinamide formyltransferase 2
LVSQLQSEFALHARAILGLPVSTAMASPGASAVIYGGVEAGAMLFDGVEEALKTPGTELRLFGKPESFVKRRMGVALARAGGIAQARIHAKQAASSVKPRAV